MYKYSGLSMLRRHFVFKMNGASGVSHMTHADIPIWLKNGVSSHSNIGHWSSLPGKKVWLGELTILT